MNTIISKDLDAILKREVSWEQFRGKTILITGAYGTLLSYMTLSLLRLNETDPKFNVTVIGLVRDKKKAEKRFGSLVGKSYFKLFEHDLSSPIDLPENIDFIIHGASYASPHHFEANAAAVIMPNVMGTYHLLELAKAKKVKSFLFFSSGAIYGKPVDGEIVTEESYGVLSPLDVKNSYAESKRMGENMCKCWQVQFGVPVKIVRLAHIYGPTMDIENDCRVVANFVRNILNGQDIVMKSDGSSKRSFCYITDATTAHFKVLLDGVDGEAYNIGNDKEYITIKELADSFASVFSDRKIKVFVEGKNMIPGDRILLSSKKVEALGWECAVSLRDGIKRTVESYECK